MQDRDDHIEHLWGVGVYDDDNDDEPPFKVPRSNANVNPIVASVLQAAFASTSEGTQITYSLPPPQSQMSDEACYRQALEPLLLEELFYELKPLFLQSSRRPLELSYHSVIPIKDFQHPLFIKLRIEFSDSCSVLDPANDWLLLLSFPSGTSNSDSKSIQLGLVTAVSYNLVDGEGCRSLCATVMTTKNSTWNSMNIHPMIRITTQLREWAALYTLEAIDKELLYQLSHRRQEQREIPYIPTCYNDIPCPESISEMLWTKLIDHHNVSQLHAISRVVHAMDRRKTSVTLIQGPPGTGKTFTIQGLVSAIMHRKPANSEVKNKILICTPSNTAIDIILTRLKLKGVFDGHPTEMVLANDDNIRREIKLVRLGDALESASEYVKDMELTNQVHQVLKVTGKFYELQSQSSDAQTKKAAAKELESLRFDTSKRIMHAVDVVGGTLSATGSDLFKNLQLTFDTVIIDEAAQATQPSALLPLLFGCKHLIMIGDPMQLPPIIKCVAVKENLEISLFEHLQRNNHDVIMLNTQYRMHPDISKFPSKTWYHDLLTDGPEILKEVQGKTLRPFRVLSPLLDISPTRFYDVKGNERGQYSNWEECNQIKNYLLDLLPRLKGKLSIGIITFYSAQLDLLKNECAQLSSCVEFNTVDGFQGREKDIIILSCVRSNAKRKIGFLEDKRRLNVAITRAKKALIVFGNKETLSINSTWAGFISSLKKS